MRRSIKIKNIQIPSYCRHKKQAWGARRNRIRVFEVSRPVAATHAVSTLIRFAMQLTSMQRTNSPELSCRLTTEFSSASGADMQDAGRQVEDKRGKIIDTMRQQKKRREKNSARRKRSMRGNVQQRKYMKEEKQNRCEKCDVNVIQRAHKHK
jgi:hypothetical protein